MLLMKMNFKRTKMKKLVIGCLLLFVSFSVFSQQEIECEAVPTDKVLKLFEKGKNSKKYDYRERVAYFKEALELDDQCL